MFEVRYALTEADHLAYAWRAHLRRGAWIAAGALTVGLALAAVERSVPLAVSLGALAAPASLGWLLTWVAQRAAVMRNLRAKPLFGRTVSLSVEAAGLRLSIPEPTVVPWSMVGRPRRRGDALELPVAGVVWVVPGRAFASAAEREGFLAAIAAGRSAPSPAPVTEWPFPRPPALDLAWRSSWSDAMQLNRWLANQVSRTRRTLIGLIGLLAGASTLAVGAARGHPGAVVEGAVGLALGALLTPWGGRLVLALRVWWAWRKQGDVDTRLRAGPDGLHALGKSAQAVPWAAVTRIESDAGHVYLGFGARHWWAVPARALSTSPAEVARALEGWRLAAPAPELRELPRGPLPPEDPNPFRAPTAS